MVRAPVLLDEVAGQVGARRILIAADRVAGEHVTVCAERGLDGQRDARVVEAGVGGQPAGAGDVAEAAEVVGLLAGEDRGAGEPVADDAVGQGEVGDLGDVGGDGTQLGDVG